MVTSLMSSPCTKTILILLPTVKNNHTKIKFCFAHFAGTSFAEHTSGPVRVHGERHRSRPGDWRQRPLLLSTALSLLLHRWSTGYRHRNQPAGLRDDGSLSADNQRHGQRTHQRRQLTLLDPNVRQINCYVCLAVSIYPLGSR